MVCTKSHVEDRCTRRFYFRFEASLWSHARRSSAHLFLDVCAGVPADVPGFGVARAAQQTLHFEERPNQGRECAAGTLGRSLWKAGGKCMFARAQSSLQASAKVPCCSGPECTAARYALGTALAEPGVYALCWAYRPDSLADYVIPVGTVELRGPSPQRGRQS